LKWCGIRTKLRVVEKGGVEKGGAGKLDLNSQNCKVKFQTWRKKKEQDHNWGETIYMW